MTDETLENPSLPGQRLRAQRESRGLTIAQAASELHVDQRLLQALEEDRFEDLGAPIFVKGHLRNYARLLGLDAATVVAEYEAAQQPAEPSLVAHRPDGPRMDPQRSPAWVGWIGWLFLVLLAVLLAGWWYYRQEGGAQFTVSPPSDRVTIVEPPTQPQVRSPSAEADRQSAGVNEDSAPPEPAVDENASPSAAEAPARTDEQPPVEGRAGEPASREVQPPVQQRPRVGQGLVLEFREESWVEVYDAGGRPILYDLIGPNARREISASGELRVFLGNAEGVEVFVGGESFDVARYQRADNTARFTVNVPAAD